MAEQQDMGLLPPAPPGPEPSPKPFPNGMEQLQAQYTIFGTGEPYSGMVVEVGGQLYTTIGGALEGYSYQVYPAMQRNGNGNGNGQDQLPGPGPGPRPRPSNNILFRRGDGTQYDRVYWLPLNYSGPWGNPGGPVKMGTPLRYDLNLSATFTEHVEGGQRRPSVMVTTQPPVGGGLRRVQGPGSDAPGGKLQGDTTDNGFGATEGDTGIIIDDPMRPDPLANQGGGSY